MSGAEQSLQNREAISKLTIGWLEAFLAVARTGSFTKAAESLFITQPSLSRTIAELEQREGCKLFQRDARPVTLTPAGDVLYKWACIIERDMNSMAQEMRLACHGIYGTLRIGYYGEPQIRLLNMGIENLKKRYAEARWRIHRAQPAQLEKLLWHDEIDVSFLHLPHANALDWIEHTTIIPGGLCALVPENHRFANRKSVSIQELEKEPYISFSREVSPYAYDIEMRPFHDIKAIPNVCAVVADIEEIGIMVGNGDGISLMSHSTANALRRIGLTVRCVELEGYTTGFDLVIAWKKGHHNQYIDAICEAMRNGGEV